MKKLLFILLLLSACKKIDVQPQPPTVQDIFSVTESTVSNGGDIYFDLKAAGTYTLTMLDENQNVITRERISGKVGQNKLKIEFLKTKKCVQNVVEICMKVNVWSVVLCMKVTSPN